MKKKIGKGLQFKKMLTCWWWDNGLVLEHPGEAVWNEDSVEASTECGINVRSWTVSDHPRIDCVTTMVSRKGEVGLVVLFREDLHRAEVFAKTGSMQLRGLLVRISLGYEDEPVSRREGGKCFSYVWKQFNLVMSDDVSKALNTLILLVCDSGTRKLFKAIYKRAAEAAQAIAMRHDGGVFTAIQMVSDLYRRVPLMIKVGDEGGDRPLKVDVIFPKRVVRVD